MLSKDWNVVVGITFLLKSAINTRYIVYGKSRRKECNFKMIFEPSSVECCEFKEV